MTLKSSLLTVVLLLTVSGFGIVIPHRPKVEPLKVTAAQILNGKCVDQFVRITGTITDVVRDDLNPAFRFFIINSDNEIIYAPSQTITESDSVLEALIGAEVSVCGKCDHPSEDNTLRRQFRWSLYIWRLDDITILKPAPRDSFAVEELGAQAVKAALDDKLVPL